MRAFFKELFQYSHHSNQQLAAILTANKNLLTEKTVSLYSHILNAHQIWNNRIDPKEKTFKVWDVHALEVCSSIDKNNLQHSLSIIDNVDMDTIIAYTNSLGDHYSNSIRDILYHVVNHSTYHRAQIATELKNAGIKPISTDYIFYKR